MKKITYLFYLLGISLSLNTFASDLCLKQGKSLGSKKGLKRPSKVCVQEIKEFAMNNPELMSINHLNNISVFGYRNMVVVDKGVPKFSYIGGKMSGLNNVKSVAISNDGEDIVILNETQDGIQELRIYSTNLLGNVMPKGIIIDDNIKNISGVAFSGAGDEIFILNNLDKKIFTVNKTGDIRSQSPSKEIHSSKMMDLTDNVKYMKVRGNEILILTDQSIIRSFSLNGSNNWSVNLINEGITQATSFDLENDKLNVFEVSGEVHSVREPASVD
jgi:hypothetical protein